MIRAVLVDDERPALNALEHQLKQYRNIQILGKFTDVKEALEIIKKENINLIFLDVDMPNLTGIEAAERVRQSNKDIQIIFVTAYDHYAIDAFEVGAVDYIMKPVIKRRLDKSINRIRKRVSIDCEIADDKLENEILCFGNFQWINKSQSVKWRTAKTKELIAYLVHHRGKPVYKEKIIEDLWPNKKIESAVKLLHTSVYNGRKTLRSIGIEKGIIYSNDMYNLNMKNINCDICEFDEKIYGKILIEADNVEYFEGVARIYRGEYLQDNDYLWSKDERERLKKIYIDILRQISQFYISQQQYNNAILNLKKILNADYYIEDIHRMLLLSYKSIGDYTSFKDHHIEAQKTFNEELGINLKLSIAIL